MGIRLTKQWGYYLLLPICLLTQAKENRHQQKIDSTVRIYCASSANKVSSGSGFVINSRHVVTNWHVVDCTSSGGQAGILLAENDIYRVEEIVWKSKIKDLALLKLDKTIARPPVILLSSEYVASGEMVIATGFPSAADSDIQSSDQLIATTTLGYIGKKVKDIEDVRLYQHSAEINPGNSGGPLFNEQGEVIGINTRKALTEVMTLGTNQQGDISPQFVRVPVGEGIGWAVQVDELLSALNDNNIPFQQTRHTPFTPLWQTWKQEPVLMSLLLSVMLLSTILLFKRPRQQVIEAISQRIHPHSVKKPSQEARIWQLQIQGQASIALSSHQLQSDSGLVIGRSQNVSDQSIDESSLSKRHCRIQWADQQLYIEDLNSRNGTRVNGIALIPYQITTLQSGDEICLADITLQVSQ